MNYMRVELGVLSLLEVVGSRTWSPPAQDPSISLQVCAGPFLENQFPAISFWK